MVEPACSAVRGCAGSQEQRPVGLGAGLGGSPLTDALHRGRAHAQLRFWTSSSEAFPGRRGQESQAAARLPVRSSQGGLAGLRFRGGCG